MKHLNEMKGGIMVYKREMSTLNRSKRLALLISDGKKLGFKPSIIKGYEYQLKQVDAEIVQDRSHRIDLRNIKV